MNDEERRRQDEERRRQEEERRRREKERPAPDGRPEAWPGWDPDDDQ